MRRIASAPSSTAIPVRASLEDRVLGRQLVARAFAAWLLVIRYGSSAERPAGAAAPAHVLDADLRDSVEVRALVDMMRGEPGVETSRRPSLALVTHAAKAFVRQQRPRSVPRRIHNDTDPIMALRRGRCGTSAPPSSMCSQGPPSLRAEARAAPDAVPEGVLKALNEIRGQWAG